MAIKKLLKLINTINIAEDIAKKDEGDNELMLIGKDVISGYDVDWSSMDEWKEDIDKGMQLGAQDYMIKAHFTPGEITEKIKSIVG